MALYRLKITSLWGATGCYRTVEFSHEHRLSDVHAVIQREFALDDDHLYSFYMSGEYFDAATEFGSNHAGPVPPAWGDEASLGKLDLTAGMDFAYLFDFGDELRHRIDVLAVEQDAPGIEIPRVVAREGTPPKQYPYAFDEDAYDGDAADASEDESAEGEPEDGSGDDAGLAGDVADESEDCDDGEDEAARVSFPAELLERLQRAVHARPGLDELTPAQAQEHLALAEAILDACPDWERFRVLNDAVGAWVHVWLSSALEQVVQKVDGDRVIATSRRWADRHGTDRSAFRHARLILEAGRPGEALEYLRGWQPSSRAAASEKELLLAEVAMRAMRSEDAEAHLRGVLAQRWVSGAHRKEAVKRLGELLRATGRGRLVRPLELKHEAIVRDRLSASIRAEQAKSSPNERCGCGSGKKFKRCCGATG